MKIINKFLLLQIPTNPINNKLLNKYKNNIIHLLLVPFIDIFRREFYNNY